MSLQMLCFFCLIFSYFTKRLRVVGAFCERRCLVVHVVAAFTVLDGVAGEAVERRLAVKSRSSPGNFD